MTILAPHFCTQQTVTLNDTNPSKYLSRFGLQPVLIIFLSTFHGGPRLIKWQYLYYYIVYNYYCL